MTLTVKSQGNMTESLALLAAEPQTSEFISLKLFPNLKPTDLSQGI